jgi:hypothetical protein
MKYVAILVGVLMLTGAGCSTRSASDMNGNEASKAPEQATGSDTANTGSQSEAGFHIYAPTFTPADAPVEGSVAVTKDHAVWVLSKDSFNTDFPSITIEENPTGAAGGVAEKRLPKLATKETLDINGATGYYGVDNGGPYNYETIIFTTTDGVEIGIWSRYYSKEVLMQVAKSMK